MAEMQEQVLLSLILEYPGFMVISPRCQQWHVLFEVQVSMHVSLGLPRPGS